MVGTGNKIYLLGGSLLLVALGISLKQCAAPPLAPPSNPPRSTASPPAAAIPTPIAPRPHFSVMNLNAPPPAETNWLEQIETLIESDADERTIATQLLALLPQLPPAGQVAAIEQLTLHLADEDYAQLRPYLLDARAGDEVLEELIIDLLNRGNAVKLPALLELARTPDHPRAEEARELLELFLDEDHGTDWRQWEETLQTWLRDNPE